MSIGSVLLQPQRIQRSLKISVGASLGDEFVQLLSRIAFNPEQAEPILTAIQNAFEAMGKRMLDNAGDGLDAGVVRLRALFQTHLDRIESFVASPPDIKEPELFFEFLLGIVEALPDLLDQLDINVLRHYVSEILNIVETEFGLTSEFMEGLVGQLIDDTVDAVEGLPQIEDAEVNATRLSLIAFLKKLKRDFVGCIHLPDITSDDIAGHLMEALRGFGLDVITEKAKCVAQALRDLLASKSALVTLTANFGAGSVGAAQISEPSSGDEYCWYATWLEQTRNRLTPSFDSAGSFFGGLGWVMFENLPAFPLNEVWVTEDSTQVVLRKPFLKDECLHEGTDLQWHQAPRYSGTENPHITFGEKLDAEFMENWAYGSAIAVDYLKSVLHIASVESPDVASNLVHMFWNFINGSIKAGEKKPLNSWINAAMGAPQAVRWVWNTFPIWLTMLAAMEGRHTKADKDASAFYFTLLADDGKQAYTYDLILNAIRDISLSVFTLLNYQGPGYPPSQGDDERPYNREFVDPIVGLTSFGSATLLNKMIPHENYTFPFAEDNTDIYWWWFFGGAISGAIGGFLGTGLGSFALAQASDGVLLGKKTGISALQGILTFWASFYSSQEGGTDGGKYNPRGDEFSGYPNHEDSPYRLPYENGKYAFCPQGNQGMWSHNDFSGTAQVYAIDLGLDQDEPIHAARDGTVVDYFDWVLNDTDPNGTQRQQIATDANASGFLIPGQTGQGDTSSSRWNFILIRHDDPFDRETDDQKEGHDRGPNGQRVITFGVYGHARLNSVRDVLTSMTPGNLETEIIGLKIRRGQPVMRCGNTGISFINHLHIDVRTNEALLPVINPGDSVSPVKLGSMRNYTIPFVFHEVTHLIGDDGVLQSLKWYKSANVLET